jgi:YjbE family integral membrane protein
VDWSQVAQPHFWLATIQIILINILLSGDNAVVIALACRKLPPRERRFGMIIGAGVASVLLIVFTAVIAFLMHLPYLRFVGGCLLFWIAVKLLIPDEEHAEGTVEAVEDLWRAVRIVVIADIAMSLDNVVAVAAAAKGSFALLLLGLCVSIPVVIAAAALIMALLDRFPILVWAGAALLGWIAGGMLVSDTAIEPYLSAPATLTMDVDSNVFGAMRQYRLEADLDLVELAFAALGAVGVLLVGASVRRTRRAAQIEAPVLAGKPQPIKDRA